MQAAQGSQYGSTVTPNCYGAAGSTPVSSSTSFQLDAYGCPVTPLRGPVQSSGGVYRRPAPYPSPQQYMIAKRTPFFAYQRCSNSAYPVSSRLHKQCQHLTSISDCYVKPKCSDKEKNKKASIR